MFPVEQANRDVLGHEEIKTLCDNCRHFESFCIVIVLGCAEIVLQVNLGAQQISCAVKSAAQSTGLKVESCVEFSFPPAFSKLLSQIT